MEIYIWPLDENAAICVEGPLEDWVLAHDEEGNEWDRCVEYYRAYPHDDPDKYMEGKTPEEAVGKVFLDMADLAEDPAGEF